MRYARLSANIRSSGVMVPGKRQRYMAEKVTGYHALFVRL